MVINCRLLDADIARGHNAAAAGGETLHEQSARELVARRSVRAAARSAQHLQLVASLSDSRGPRALRNAHCAHRPPHYETSRFSLCSTNARMCVNSPDDPRDTHKNVSFPALCAGSAKARAVPGAGRQCHVHGAGEVLGQRGNKGRPSRPQGTDYNSYQMDCHIKKFKAHTFLNFKLKFENNL